MRDGRTIGAMLTNQNTATLYAAAIHVLGLVAVVVLMALGKVTSSEGLPILAGLVGVGVGGGLALLTPQAPALGPVVPAPAVAALDAARAATAAQAAADVVSAGVGDLTNRVALIEQRVGAPRA